MRFRFRQTLPALLVLAFLGAQYLAAMPPPTKGMVEAYKRDGSWARRRAFAEELGNHRVDPALAKAASARLKRLAESQGIALPKEAQILSTPPSSSRGLPTTGTPRFCVLMIDFSDYPADAANTQAAVTSRIFADGDGVQAAPYESLKSYYSRASYGQLTMAGTVLPYYRPAYTRASMGAEPTTAQRQNLIKEALNHHVALGHDFAQYDNNGDGKIDYFVVLWTGPDTGWANFWWAYQTSWGGTSPKISGKTLGTYVWQWFSNASQGTRNAPAFDPKVLIHETGHALGLPDYYDYDDTIGPDGGVGGLDMMDANKGDHNCFSKWLLDWITPTVYTASTAGVTLRSSGDHDEAAIVMDTNPGSTFGEYFMVQNRQRVAGTNDGAANYPADGLLIWHVDARLNTAGTDFKYDNSVTDHKLLRLMEADGLEQIENGSGYANAGDYYTSSREFGPSSAPNSCAYDGSVTKMGVKNISAAGASMTFDVFRVADASAPTGSPATPTGTTSLDTVTFNWTLGNAADPDSGIGGFLLQVGTTPGGSDVFNGGVGNVLSRTLTDLGLRDGQTLYARVAALNGAALASSWSSNSAGVTIALPTFPGTVLDNANLTFKTIGPWTTDITAYYSGTSSARTAIIADQASTYLQTRVTGPGTFDFYWKVNSEPDYDFLTFSIDGVDQDGKISGTSANFARSATFNIPAGSHILRWTYAKDLNTAPANDGGWVDMVTWNGLASVAATVSPASYTTLAGKVVPFTATVTNFASDNSVNWSVTSSGGIFSPTQTASGAATSLASSSTPGTYTLTATPVETPHTPGTASLTLVAPESVNVGVTGSASTVLPNAPVTFTSTVTPLTDASVTWAADGGTLGTPNGNTISWSSASAGTFHITATSAVATGRSNSCSVTVLDPASLTLSVDHPTATIVSGATQVLVGTTSYGTINWTLPAGQGSLSAASGLTSTYTSPAALFSDLVATVTLTHSTNPAKTATSVITVKTLDVNGDRAFDLRDVLALAKEWGTTAPNACLSGASTVGDADLALLLTSLGF